MYVALWGILGNIMEYFVYGYYYVHIYKVYKIDLYDLRNKMYLYGWVNWTNNNMNTHVPIPQIKL